MIRIFLICFCISLWLPVFGQSPQNLNIIVKDQKRTPLPGATVKLTRIQDSTYVYSITDHMGRALFTQAPVDKYQIDISYIGFESVSSEITNKEQQVFEFVLSDQALSLGEVTITATRPAIRQEGDKMIIDPEPLVGISSNTLEMLETVPGVFVDQDGGIFLSSTTPAAVYINGREQRMGTQNINSILRSLPPGSIQHIEVIRTPSSRFDASSSGGIINIVLKKGVRLGRFGSLNMGMNQGTYGNRFIGFNLNTSGDRTTWYLNTSVNHNAYEEALNSDRMVSSSNNLFQSARTHNRANQGFIGFGMNYEATPKLHFSYDSRINGSLPVSTAMSINQMTTAEAMLSEINNNLRNESQVFNLQQDLGMVLKIDTLGSEWENRFNFSFNQNNATQDYLTRYLSPSPYVIDGFGDNSQIRSYLNFQSDLTYRMPLAILLETGLKASFQNLESQSDYFIINQNTAVDDPLRSNAFNYQENTNAAYLQASRELPGDLLLKTGLRLEQTHMRGNQILPSDTNFRISRFDLFPYVYLSRKMFEAAGYEIRGFAIYRRSINRPDYQSLNPHIRFLDPYLYETGNPALKPQFTQNFEANLSLDEFPIFAIGRNNISDIFAGVVYQDPIDSVIAVRTFDNVGRNRETYFRIMGAVPPVNRYFFALGAQYNLNHYEGKYEGQDLSFRRGSWRFFTFHSMRFSPRTRLTLSGFMMHNGQLNFYELKTFGQVNMGLSHSFMDQKLQVTINARDIFRTMVTHFELNQGTYPVYGNRYMDNQRIGFNIRYSFGVRKKDERASELPFDFGE